MEERKDICEGYERDSVQQLDKLAKDKNERFPIYPLTYIQAVYDARTKERLDSILWKCNNVYLPWMGSAGDTRIQLPFWMRRKGIIITYKNLDEETITEKLTYDLCIADDFFRLDSSWTRITDALPVGGNITIGSNGNWFQDGVDTGFKAQGPKGDNGLTPMLRTVNNKLRYSYDGEVWNEISEYIAAWFRFQDNKIQISRDQKTWSDLSKPFTQDLYIKGYVATSSALPSTGVKQGDIYMVGPTYAAEDTEHKNPIYRMYVYNDSGWVDNGVFQSIAAGVVQTIGNSETEVMSQKAVSSIVGLDTYPVFSDTKDYVKGEIVNYGGLLYEFTADHEAGAWIGTDVKETSLKNYLLNNDIKSMSFSGKAYVDLGSMANYLSDGSFDKYINDPLYDCVWVYIYPNCTNLNISGATHSLIGYFKDIIPSTNNYLGRDFKENAVLCLINLKRSENPNGYNDLIITQDGAGATRKYVIDSINSHLNDYISKNNELVNSTFSSLNYRPYQNILNVNSVLNGWSLSDGVWLPEKNTVSSDKIYLRDGCIYTVQGINPFNNNNIYIAMFDQMDNYIGRSFHPIDNQEENNACTFKFKALKGTSYVRFILKGNANVEYNPDIIQLEVGGIKTSIKQFSGKDLFALDDNDSFFLQQLRLISKEKPKGKNLLNPNDLMYGYTLSSGMVVEHPHGVFSNRLFLEDGVNYSFSHMAIYSKDIKNLYLAYFDRNGNFIKRTSHSLSLEDGDLYGSVTIKYVSYGAYFVRALIQSDEIESAADLTKAQIEQGSSPTDYEEYKGTSYDLHADSNNNFVISKNILLTGASFAFPGNEWFSHVVNDLNITGYNKAVSGETIVHTANKMAEGTLYSKDELETFDIFMIFHSHNQVVDDYENIKEDYRDYELPFGNSDKSICWDYVLKKYYADCYALKDDPSSKWYGTKSGKPCIIVVCTHWHDARTIFNESIRNLQKKWGFILCEFDKNIGFSKNQVHPITNEQISILHADTKDGGDTEVINGVTYGWHPTEYVDAWIQKRMASIVEAAIRNL